LALPCSLTSCGAKDQEEFDRFMADRERRRSEKSSDDKATGLLDD
jgi:hypothetical protein